MPKPSSPNSLKLVWTKERKDAVKVNPSFIYLKPKWLTVDNYQQTCGHTPISIIEFIILFGYTDNYGILLGNRESRYKSWGSSIQGGLVFQLVCCFHRYGTYSSKSTVRPKMESCFQDGACSVSFLLHSPLLMLLTHSMSIIHRDILHPDSPTSNLGELTSTFGLQSS